MTMSAYTTANVSPSAIDAARQRVAEQLKIDLVTPSQVEDNEKKRKEVSRSFLSDTITVPTKEMYEYAVNSTLGDDVYHEPTTIALEAHVARITGKEAALFMSSGTQSNQIGLRTHLKQPPYSVLCDFRSHVYRHEAGGISFHSSAAVTPVQPTNGHHLTLEDVKANLIETDGDIHAAPTAVVSLENTLDGGIFPQSEIIAISEYAHAHNVAMHLDGARIWHVAAETGTSLRELCDPFDTVSLCLSKGLGAPVGSVLVGPKEFIRKARHFRKLFGGGMRQTGLLAASAAYALTHNFAQLPRVHALARRLQAGLEYAGVDILKPAETCMIFFEPKSIGSTVAEISRRAAELPEPLGVYSGRLVVHLQTTEAAVDDLVRLVHKIAKEKRAEGFIKPTKQVKGATAFKYTSKL